jgi:hypothetical protein
VPALEARLNRIAGTASGTTPGADAGGGKSAAQLWDDAVAKHGRAKVLKEFGPRPADTPPKK